MSGYFKELEQPVYQCKQRDDFALLFFLCHRFCRHTFFNQPGTSFMNTYVFKCTGRIGKMLNITAIPYRNKKYPEEEKGK